jgi:NAD-dependent dihydropyrimidine dehydrogenase PreA subunit
MTLKSIDYDKCERCELRIRRGCPVIDSCPTDVLRYDKEKKPVIRYPEDCHSCFLCEIDCPNKAINVSPEIPLPILPY